MFFDARLVDGAADRTYSAADLAAAKRAYYDDGVLSAQALAVRANAGMSVTVDPGAAVVSGYTYVLDEPKILALSPTGQYPRVDVVALRLDLAARRVALTVVTGVAGDDPATPALTASGDVFDLPLAKIALPASAHTAALGRVTDLRTFAATRVMEAPFRAMIAEAIEALPKLGEAELAAARSLISRILTSGAGDKVLCDDGRYRTAAVTERVELARYEEAGEYEFDPAEHPSANGLYDVEVLGAGGAGGSAIGDNRRGGGGGAGVCVRASSIAIGAPVAVKVGAGGTGTPGMSGDAGGMSVFGEIWADGGYGGEGGNFVAGGKGGETSPFAAKDGADGSNDTTSAAYLDECGAGAASAFGPGAPGYERADVSLGVNASTPGSGGSGAGGPSSLTAILAGGKGAPGAVVVYGCVAPGEGA